MGAFRAVGFILGIEFATEVAEYFRNAICAGQKRLQQESLNKAYTRQRIL